MIPRFLHTAYQALAYAFKSLLPRLSGCGLLSVCVLAMALILQSCRHSAIICPDGGGRVIDVRFMWDDAPDAMPDGMTLYFFPVNSDGNIWRFDIAGRDGGKVELPFGSYRLLAFNNDLPRIDYSETGSYDSFTANARFAGKTLVYAPGLLYIGTVGFVDVTVCGVEYTDHEGCGKNCPRGLVRCYPKLESTIYNVIVRDIDGMSLVRSASATIDGVASAMKLASGDPTGYVVAESLALSSVRQSSEMNGSTTGFGSIPGEDEYWLTITVTRTDGKTFAKRFDVSSQVLNSSNPRNVTIIVDGLDIPDDDLPPSSGDDVGIEVGVDGWHEIVIDINTDSAMA